jgi:hypothetical protein
LSIALYFLCAPRRIFVRTSSNALESLLSLKEIDVN